MNYEFITFPLCDDLRLNFINKLIQKYDGNTMIKVVMLSSC